MLSICRAFEFLPLYKRTFRFVPAIPLDCTVPRIRSGFLPTCGALQGFTPTREWQSHSCRQQTKFAALRYVQEGFFAMEQDLRLDRPMISRQAGMQRLLWGEKFLSGLYATVRSVRIFCHGTRSAPGPPEISKWYPSHTNTPPVPGHTYWYLPPLAVPVRHHLSSFLFL